MQPLYMGDTENEKGFATIWKEGWRRFGSWINLVFSLYLKL